jgi:hypothetical protein
MSPEQEVNPRGSIVNRFLGEKQTGEDILTRGDKKNVDRKGGAARVQQYPQAKEKQARSCNIMKPCWSCQGMCFLMIDPGFPLDKGGQGLKLLLGELNLTLLFLGLVQVPLKIQERFPKIVEHGLKGVQSQDEGFLMLAFGQQFPGPL